MPLSLDSGTGSFSLFKHPAQFHLFGDREFKGEGLEHGEGPITATQVHGDKILCLRDDGHGLVQEGLAQGELEGDGLVTDRNACFIAVATADCVPVLLFDPKRKIIAALHAGWRGSVLNIAAQGVTRMVSDFGSEAKDILAGIGPSIGPCCFEVGEDVLSAIEEKTPHKVDVIRKFGRKFGRKSETNRWSCDLPKLNRMQLISVGLPPEQITVAGLCTSCLPERYYSFRRDKKKLGNMLSGIMLR